MQRKSNDRDEKSRRTLVAEDHMKYNCSDYGKTVHSNQVELVPVKEQLAFLHAFGLFREGEHVRAC